MDTVDTRGVCYSRPAVAERRGEVSGIILVVRLTDVQSGGDPAMRNLAVNLLLVTTRNSSAL